MIGLNRENTVWLCKTKLEKNNANQLTFTDKTSQINYFLNNLYRTFNNVSFVREPVEGETKNYINLEMGINEAYNCNYVMYKNSNQDRYYFAFVDRIEYKNENVTRLYLSADSWQNYQFDLTFKKSFVERQTPSSYAEKNTLADAPATGQLVEAKFKKINFLGGYFCFFSANPTIDDTSDSIPYNLKIGSYSIPCWTFYYSPLDVDKMAKDLGNISSWGYGDRIVSVIFAPYIKSTDGWSMFTYNTTNNRGSYNLVTEIPKSSLTEVVELDISDVTGYGKELTYPYAKIVVQDLNTGLTTVYAPEKFSNGIKFEIRATIDEIPTYKVIPMDYQGQFYSYGDSLVVRCNTSLPTLNNQYAKYMLQQGENNKINAYATMGAFGLSFLTSVATGNPIPVIAGGVASLTELSKIAAQENAASKLGNQITSFTDGAEERIVFENGIKISIMTMDSNHKTIATNFWKMLGYPVRSLSDVNIKTNSNYNYVKTLNCNIVAPKVPQNELENIKAMFDRGVTLWHNPDTMYNY